MQRKRSERTTGGVSATAVDMLHFLAASPGGGRAMHVIHNHVLVTKSPYCAKLRAFIYSFLDTGK